MKCPIDATELVMTDRNGVEIDYCPACRGVWLDRGELDKIIERSVEVAPPPPPQARVYEARDRDDRGRDDRDYDDRDRDRDRDYDDRDGRPRRKKRGGFLEDIFDF